MVTNKNHADSIGKKAGILKKFFFLLALIMFIALLAFSIIFKKEYQSEAISVEPQILKSTVKPGEILEHTLIITNHREEGLLVNPKLVGVAGNLPSIIELPRLASRDVQLQTSIPEEKYGTYVGEALFNTDYSQTSALIVIDSETKSIDFDATIEQIISLAEVIPGNYATFLITLYNIKNKETESLSIEYSLISSSGAALISESERIPTGSSSWLRASVSKSIRIPENIAPGKYVFSVKLSAKDSASAASLVFEVNKMPSAVSSILCPPGNIGFCSFFIVLLLIVAFFIGVYAYYFLGIAIVRRIREKHVTSRLEIMILIFIALTASGVLYQISTNTGIATKIASNYTEILKTIAILALILASLELLRRIGSWIVSRFEEIRKRHKMRKARNKLKKAIEENIAEEKKKRSMANKVVTAKQKRMKANKSHEKRK